jgi:hypothetical protein
MAILAACRSGLLVGMASFAYLVGHLLAEPLYFPSGGSGVARGTGIFHLHMFLVLEGYIAKLRRQHHDLGRLLGQRYPCRHDRNYGKKHNKFHTGSSFVNLSVKIIQMFFEFTIRGNIFLQLSQGAPQLTLQQSLGAGNESSG